MKIHYFNSTYKIGNNNIIGYDSLENLIICINNNFKKININEFLKNNLNMKYNLKLFIYQDYYLSNLNIFKNININAILFNYNELPISILEYQ